MTPEQEKLITERLNNFTLVLSEHVAQTVRDEVKITVNGKIDEMRRSFEMYKQEDFKWKNEQVRPMIDIFNNLKWGERVLIRVGIFLGGLVTFAIGVVELFKIIKK